jgi:uncharacterized protein YjbI with pentapeptide repeats
LLRSAHWPGIHVDLSYATLIDFDFRGAHVASINFGGCLFASNANLRGLEVDREASFRRSTFRGSAKLDDVVFHRGVSFHKARFKTSATFNYSRFLDSVDFVDASFHMVAQFTNASISNDEFDGASFRDKATFRGAKLH